MRRPALRTRVALAAAAAVFLAVAVLGGASQLLIGHELRSSLDRGLEARATDVARLSVSAPALLTAPGALDAPYGGRDLVVEVLDRRERIVARSAVLGGRLLPARRLVAAAIAGGRTGFGRVALSGDDVRVFVAPLPDGGPAGGGAVIVGSSTAEIERTRERLAKLLLVSALAAAALGAAAAAALTSRGMRPLRRLSAGAGEISRTGDPSRRLPPGGSGEVAELSRTLNGMLDALERARATERRFLADASHELRTPVTALVGNVAYLARHGADDGVLADLQADAARLARLIDDLLTLERRDDAPARSERVALGVLAREAAAAGPEGAVRVVGESAAPGWETAGAPPGLKTTGAPPGLKTAGAAPGRDATGAARTPDEGATTVLGDPQALARAVDNLVANALAHGAPPVEITVSGADGRARLTVADSGPGLAAEQAEAAFGRFWRGPDAARRPGSGLGLAIVRDIARAHGGDVRVAGARFTLELPVAPIVTKPSRSGSTVDPMSSHGSQS